MFDCGACQDPQSSMYQPDVMKRAWHCGWMDESEWMAGRPEVPTHFGDEKYEENVCPGWLIAQPLVQEIAMAHRSFEKGNWDAMYPQAANALCEGVECFSSIVDGYQAYRTREAIEKARQKNG